MLKKIMRLWVIHSQMMRKKTQKSYLQHSKKRQEQLIKKHQTSLTHKKIGGDFSPNWYANKYDTNRLGAGTTWQKCYDAADAAYKYLEGGFWDAHKPLIKTADGKPFTGSFRSFLVSTDIDRNSVTELGAALLRTKRNFSKSLDDVNDPSTDDRENWKFYFVCLVDDFLHKMVLDKNAGLDRIKAAKSQVDDITKIKTARVQAKAKQKKEKGIDLSQIKDQAVQKQQDQQLNAKAAINVSKLLKSQKDRQKKDQITLDKEKSQSLSVMEAKFLKDAGINKVKLADGTQIDLTAYDFNRVDPLDKHLRLAFAIKENKIGPTSIKSGNQASAQQNTDTANSSQAAKLDAERAEATAKKRTAQAAQKTAQAAATAAQSSNGKQQNITVQAKTAVYKNKHADVPTVAPK